MRLLGHFQRRFAALAVYGLVSVAVLAPSAAPDAVFRPAALATTSSLTDKLTVDKTGVEVTGLPSGAASIKVAVMKNLAGEGVTYKVISISQTTFTPPSGDPVVDMQADSSTGAPIGNWAGRLQTSPAAGVTSITDKLTTDKTAIEVTALPAGTSSIKVATMKNLAGEGVTYRTIPATQKTYTPAATTPVVDVQADSSTGAPIGNWAGRLQTSSVPKEETQAEKEAREKAEREAREKAEKEAKEREEREKEAAGGKPHVAVIVEENRNRSEVIGSSSMPYLNGLAKEYGNTTEWHGVAHPSLPNYLALASGSTQGQNSDTCEPSFSGETIGSQLSKASIGWKAYMEGLPAAGSTTCESGNYAKKHNPFAYFPSSNGSHVVPGSQYPTDLSAGSLPSFVWYTPDLCNDGHNCGNSTVDASLKNILTPLLASKWYAENGTVIVTYDEDAGGEGNRVATVVINQNAKGRTLTTNGNHYGTLATIEKTYGLPLLGNASSASTLLPLLEAPKTEEPPSSSMKVGVDAGGWAEASAINDFAGAIKFVRSGYQHYNSDSQMELLAKAGVTLMPLFFEGNTMSELDTTAHVETIMNWCRRYCKGGSYWAGKTDLGASTIELVNEPGNPVLHSGEPQGETSKRAYIDLTQKVHTALAGISPTPKLLVSYDGGYEGDQYGEWIFSRGAAADGLTVHPYGGHVERARSAQGNRERVTRAHEHSTLPVYVTEVGWPTCGETADSLNWSEAEQANNITNFGKWARELGYVADFTNFNYADYSGNCYGIVHAAGSPHKLSYEALKHA